MNDKKKWSEPKLVSISVKLTANACQSGDAPGGGPGDCIHGLGNDVGICAMGPSAVAE